MSRVIRRGLDEGRTLSVEDFYAYEDALVEAVGCDGREIRALAREAVSA